MIPRAHFGTVSIEDIKLPKSTETCEADNDENDDVSRTVVGMLDFDPDSFIDDEEEAAKQYVNDLLGFDPDVEEKGSASSGNYGHGGRPGQRGGSSGKGGMLSTADIKERRKEFDKAIEQEWKGPAADIGQVALVSLATERDIEARALFTPEGKIAAVAAYGKSKDGESMHIKYIASGYKGYGTQMMREIAKDAAADKNIKFIDLEAAPQAASFYEHLGLTVGYDLHTTWQREDFTAFAEKKDDANEPEDGVFAVEKSTEGTKGSALSGNRGHGGRPGQRGGSAPAGEGAPAPAPAPAPTPAPEPPEAYRTVSGYTAEEVRALGGGPLTSQTILEASQKLNKEEIQQDLRGMGVRVTNSFRDSVPLDVQQEIHAGVVHSYLPYETSAKLNSIKVERMEEDTYAQYHVGSMYGGSITFNERWTDNPDSFRTSLSRGEESGFHPESCDTIKSVADHEIGHALSISRQGGVLGERYLDRIVESHGTSGIKNRVSGYATRNHRELCAESWASRQNSNHVSKPARDVTDVMLRRISR